MGLRSHLEYVNKHNARIFRASPVSEISGALGDLGTLLPIFIALSQNHSIAVASTLVFAGLANIATGALFGVPIPVQPMKAIAAVAIEQHFQVQHTATAGLIVSIVVLFLSISGLLQWVGRVVPIPIVRGIQVGAGLQLVVAAGNNLLRPLDWIRPSWTDNHIWTLCAFLFLLFCTAFTRRPIPYALVITILGFVLAIVRPHHQHHRVTPGIWHPRIYVPTWHDFKVALPAAVGQIPLTTLNSILATSHLSKQLLPEEPTPSLAHLGLSLSITNFASFIFGVMPICHGSGGLAGQYRYGARSGSSVIFLGVVKLILGLFFASPLLWAIERFPHSLLGVMVIGAGIELAKMAENINLSAIDLEEDATSGREFRAVDEAERQRRFSVMLVTVAGILAFKNDAVGFLAGLVWHLGINADIIWASRRRGSWLESFRTWSTERQPLL